MEIKNRRHWFYIGGLVLLTIACLLIFRVFEDDSREEANGNSLEAGDVAKEVGRASAERASKRSPSPRKFQGVEVRFVATPLPKPPVEPEKIEYPKYRAGGSGTRGAIRDSKGNLIRRATNDSPAFSITISPNDQLIWVNGGDRKSYIINTKGEELVNLPIVPPGKDMFIFGRWVWLDNNRLLGESGVQKYDEEGKLVTCCGGDNVSESRFYVYDLRTNEMKGMRLPKKLRGKVLNISKVLKSGEIQLGHEGDKPGWYRVVDLDENNRKR